jgi:radical S-adenosyl methionine domain-containing protein 2
LYILLLEDAKKGLLLLKQAGMRKLNFASREPFLYPKFISELAKYCKDNLHIESVLIVTNGSLVKPNFFNSYSQYIDIMAVSCDSFNEATNVKIGRGTGKHLYHL